jgi:hypothetical protein
VNIYVPDLLITTLFFLCTVTLVLSVFGICLWFLTNILEKYLKRFFAQTDIMKFRPVYKEWVKSGRPKVDNHEN